MRLGFVKTNPAGYTTILILDPVPVRAQAEIALDLMEPGVIDAEQVGFVTSCGSCAGCCKGVVYVSKTQQHIARPSGQGEARHGRSA